MNSNRTIWLFSHISAYQWVSCTVHGTHKSHFLVIFLLKISLTVLFTYLKIILLQCFQFSIFSENKLYSNGPINCYPTTKFRTYRQPLTFSSKKLGPFLTKIITVNSWPLIVPKKKKKINNKFLTVSCELWSVISIIHTLRQTTMNANMLQDPTMRNS